MWNFVPAAGLVMGSEFLVDWFKHAFITKFNDIKPEVCQGLFSVSFHRGTTTPGTLDMFHSVINVFTLG